ncbi:PAQR family membrane homeostasis protein TrhA [Acidipropionibacterium jensenii]|uniref:Hemolysin n=1 Tax=Acidipropionibacterium jensenii TaxID=1749 RepID=A0A3Q9UN28_9ACTN|nr:hemolysin III family protein [Acidipropionibacterium jensenii]AZZ41647.1 hemolysin [Acidipropionibacterium jensenii]MDN5976972.1 hemolysin III family protein [Acidipropionibacterium jensenii]MDN5995829.1 hemolysin III family protein [Acidipropionibacterium jensenii]MDN6020882.1 hemolysin III family protein [Acidipropionibacterium jensenii]MDN6426115.1 hemolysin III family protein [Acidipropionibacterium jensenii]
MRDTTSNSGSTGAPSIDRAPAVGPKGPDDLVGVPAEDTPPRLRGWIHTVMAPLILLCGLGLIVAGDSWQTRLAVAVWICTGVELFGNSAVYHRVRWSPRVKAVLRRIDHTNIAVFIAGTYTPLAVSMLTGTSRVVLLAVIWGAAVIDVTFRWLWIDAPRWLYTGLYIVMGWGALWWLPQFWHAGGPAVVILVLVGGVAYSAGAVSYALKKPNPSPTWFGFHEVFHAGTAIGAICHAIAIGLVVI